MFCLTGDRTPLWRAGLPQKGRSPRDLPFDTGDHKGFTARTWPGFLSRGCRMFAGICMLRNVASALRALRRKKEINVHCLSPVTTLATVHIQTYNGTASRFFLTCFREKEAEAQGNRVTWPRITQLLVKEQRGVLNPRL